MADHVTAALAHKQASRAGLYRALGAVPDSPAAPAPESEKVQSFDGGARLTPPLPPPSHDETLRAIFANLGRGSRPAPRW